MTSTVKTIAACTTIALASVSMAHADSSLLFPYIISGKTTYTFISLFQNPYAPRNADQATDKVSTFFKVYVSHRGTPPNEYNSGFSAHEYQIDNPGTLFQLEIGGHFDLPNDFGDQSSPPYPSLPFIFLDDDSYGYITVQYADDSQIPGGGQMYGEAMLVDTAAGMVFSYPALHIHSANGDFSQSGGTVFASSWYPEALGNTSWFVLPLRNFVEDSLYGKWGTTEITIDTNQNSAGVFGRNGTYYESELKQHVVDDFGIFNLNDLLLSNGHTSMGGWATFKSSQPALIWKIQQSNILGYPAMTMGAVPIIQ